MRVSDDQEDVARLFEHYDLVSAPVVDEIGEPLGLQFQSLKCGRWDQDIVVSGCAAGP